MNIYFKSFIFTAVMAASSCAFISCDDDEDMPASFAVSDYTFDVNYEGLTADGDRAMFTLAATDSWKVSKADEWLTLSETEGNHGSYNIFVVADENTTYESRRGFIEIVMGNKKELITVNQGRKTIELAVNTKTLAVNAIGKTEEGEDASFIVTTNADWTVSVADGCNWIKAVPAEGKEGSNKVTLQVDANTTGAARSAKVNVKAADVVSSVTVSQDFSAFATNVAGGFSSVVLGASADEAKMEVELNCLEAWSVTAKPEWLTVSPDNGQAGKALVVISAPENKDDAREGTLTFTSTSGIKLDVAVSQLTSKVAYDDKAVGHVYFSDNMSWAVGGDDQVGSVNGAKTNARNIYTWDYAGNGFESPLPTLQGLYEDLNASAKIVYTMDGYLKMNKGNAQTALRIKPAFDITAGCQANLEVSFKAARNQTDGVSLSVAIEGPGTIVDAADAAGKLSAPMEPEANPKNDGNPWRWNNFSVKIKGATAETKIVIGETQYVINRATRDGYYRLFIDDIAVKRIAND